MARLKAEFPDLFTNEGRLNPAERLWVYGRRGQPCRRCGTPIACGHWSTLGVLLRPDLMALDSGCVWGGCLSALRLDADAARHELIQVDCEQAQVPGGD